MGAGPHDGRPREESQRFRLLCPRWLKTPSPHAFLDQVHAWPGSLACNTAIPATGFLLLSGRLTGSNRDVAIPIV